MNCQTIIAGVGGQGVLFAAKVLTEIARGRKLPVLGSQTFGMAQRGGSVMTHLKMGSFESPMVCEGDADLLLALDCTEAHRTLPYLHPQREGKRALCVVNSPDSGAFPDPRVAGLLADMGVIVLACNADAVAMEMNQPLVANLVLLGFGTTHAEFPFSHEEMREATRTLSNPAHLDTNLAALERGHALKNLLQ